MKKLSLLIVGVCLVVFFSGCRDKEAAVHPQSFATSGNFTAESQPAPSSEAVAEQTASVYVCKSAGAKKYHYDSGCRGLSNCKHEVAKMDRKDAEARGLGLCGWED